MARSTYLTTLLLHCFTIVAYDYYAQGNSFPRDFRTRPDHGRMQEYFSVENILEWQKFEIHDTGTNEGAEKKNTCAKKCQYFNMF